MSGRRLWKEWDQMSEPEMTVVEKQVHRITRCQTMEWGFPCPIVPKPSPLKHHPPEPYRSQPPYHCSEEDQGGRGAGGMWAKVSWVPVLVSPLPVDNEEYRDHEAQACCGAHPESHPQNVQDSWEVPGLWIWTCSQVMGWELLGCDVLKVEAVLECRKSSKMDSFTMQQRLKKEQMYLDIICFTIRFVIDQILWSVFSSHRASNISLDCVPNTSRPHGSIRSPKDIGAMCWSLQGHDVGNLLEVDPPCIVNRAASLCCAT